MEIPSSHAGVVKELKVKVGDKVSKGIADRGARGAAAPLPRRRAGRRPASAPTAPAAAAGAGSRAPPPHRRAHAADRRAAAARAGRANGALPHASPSIRKFARELGVPLEEVKGTGPKGRITQEDVQGFVKARDGRRRAAPRRAAAKAPAAAAAARRCGLLPWPQVDFTKFGADRAQGRCRASRRSAAPTCTATG